MNIKPLSGGNTKIIFDNDSQYTAILAMMDNQLRGKNRQLDSVLNAATEAMQAGYIPNDSTEKTNPDDKNDLGKPTTIISNETCSRFVALFLQTVALLENGDDSSEFQHKLDQLGSENYSLKKQNEELNRRAAELEGRIQDDSELNTNLLTLKTSNAQLQAQLKTATDAKTASETTLAQLKDENAQLQSRINSMESNTGNSEELQRQLSDCQNKLNEVNSMYSIGKARENQLAAENEELKKKIDDYSKDASGAIPTELTDLRKENDDLKAQLEEAKNQPVADSEEMSKIKSENESLNAQIETLRSENEALKNTPVDSSLYISKEDYESLRNMLEEVTADKNELDEKSMSDANEIIKLQNENAELKKSSGNSVELASQVSELSSERDQLSRELKSAREDVERFRQASVNAPSQSDYDALKKENELIKLKFAQLYTEREALKKKKGGLFGK